MLMNKIMTEQVNINMKLQRRLSVGLAVTTLVVALIFFASSMLLMQSWFAALVAQAGLDPQSSAPVFVISAIVLSTGAFVISWKQRSFLGAGLLAASGVIFMLHPLTSIFTIHPQMAMATGHSAVMVVPGPILGIISGLGILGLGVAKGIRTGRITVAAAK
jgi:hypothetical protein